MFKYVAGIVAFFLCWYYLGETWQVIAPFLLVIFVYHKIHKFVVGIKSSFQAKLGNNVVNTQNQQPSQEQERAQTSAITEVKRAPEPVQQLAPTEESEEEFIARVRAMNS